MTTVDESISMKSEYDKKKALAVMQFFNAHDEPTYIVGGAVRDSLRGVGPADFDLATTATPSRIVELAEKLGAKVIPTGFDHGTLTLVYKRTPFEITTLRQDVRTDGRHAEVSFTRELSLDAARRDFTVNALYEDAAGKIHDYVSGRKDLGQGILRFVGDGDKRCTEDHLRILRLYRFWGQLGLNPDPSARAAAKNHYQAITSLSQERVTLELMCTLSRTSDVAVFEAMHSDGVLDTVLHEPQVDFSTWLGQCRPVIQNYSGDCKAEFLLASFYRVPEAAIKAGKFYRLANAQIAAMGLFCDYQRLFAGLEEQADQMDLIDRVEDTLGDNQFCKTFVPLIASLNKQEISAPLRKLEDLETRTHSLRKARMPLDGRDLKDRFGFANGPRLGSYLARLKRTYRNERWRSKKEGLATVAAWLAAEQ